MSELDEAERDYRRALHRYGRAIAESQTTADGEPFRLAADGPLYAIEDNLGWPAMRVIERHRVRVAFAVRSNAVVLEDVAKGPHGGRWNISELYVRLSAAMRELLRVRKQRLAEYEEDVREMEAQIGAPSVDSPSKTE